MTVSCTSQPKTPDVTYVPHCKKIYRLPFITREMSNTKCLCSEPSRKGEQTLQREREKYLSALVLQVQAL